MRKKQKAEEKSLREGLEKNVARIEPTESEKLTNARNQRFLEQINAGTDVGGIDALKPNLQIYNRAIENQGAERRQTGVLGSIGRGDNAGVANYDTYMKYKRQQDAAGGLENAYNAANADITGSTFNYAQLANQRNLGRAGAGAQAYDTFMKNKGPGLFDRIMQIGGLAAQGVSAWRA